MSQDNVVDVESVVPEPPGVLPEDGQGWAFWCQIHSEYVVSEAQQLRLLYEACRIIDRIEHCEREMDNQEMLVLGGNRQLIINPLLAHAKDLRGSLLQVVKALALPLEYESAAEVEAAAVRSARARAAANARWSVRNKAGA